MRLQRHLLSLRVEQLGVVPLALREGHLLLAQELALHLGDLIALLLQNTMQRNTTRVRQTFRIIYGAACSAPSQAACSAPAVPPPQIPKAADIEAGSSVLQLAVEMVDQDVISSLLLLLVVPHCVLRYRKAFKPFISPQGFERSGVFSQK